MVLIILSSSINNIFSISTCQKRKRFVQTLQKTGGFPLLKNTGRTGGGGEVGGEGCPQLNIPKTTDVSFFKPETYCFLTIVPTRTKSK